MIKILLVLIAILQSTTSYEIPSNFIMELLKKFNKKYVIWHLNQNHQTVPMKRNITNFGRLYPSMIVEGQQCNSQQDDMNLYFVNNQNMSGLLDIFTKRQFHENSLWTVDLTNLSEPLDDVLKKLDKLEAEFDDEILLFRVNNMSYISFWEVYKISQNTPLRTANEGYWSEESGVILENENHRNKRLRDLQGLHLKLASKVSKPYILEMIPNNETGYTMRGVFAEVFHNLQSLLNFTYTLEKPPDGYWGSKLPNNSWTGMVGMLIRKEIDIAVTDFTVTKERSSYISFSQPLQTYYHTLFIKNPSETFNYKAFIEPLHYLSWALIALFCTLVPPLLCLTTSVGRKDENYKEFSWFKSYIFLLSALTMRGWDTQPTKNSGKVVFLSLLVFGLLTYYHWEAMLISYLSTRFTVLPFNNIPELITNTNFKISIFPGSAYIQTFNQSNDPYWKEAWKYRIEPNLIEEFNDFTTDDFVRYIIDNDDVSYYDNYFSLRTFDEYARCEIKAIKAKYDVKPLAMGFQKGSPFLDLFNYYLKEMRETGALDQIMKKYDSGPQVCEDYSGKPLGFGSVSAAFAIMIVAMIFVLTVFLLELVASFFNFKGFDLNSDPPKNEVHFLRRIISKQAKELKQMKAKMKLVNNVSWSRKPSKF